MALSGTVIFEVQGTAGSDNYGGGYNSAAVGGTDYSLTGTPHVVIDGTTITGTIQATTTQFKLAGYTVASTDIGNVVNINGGTMTAGRYQISSVTTGASNLWTFDRSGGTAGQTGTGNMGGCLATIQTAWTAMTVDGQVCWIKADGNYSITVALAPPATTPSVSRLIGYGSSRGDGTKAVVIVGAGAGINAVNLSNTGWALQNFEFDGTATSGSQGLVGINITTAYQKLVNCKIHHFANEGILLAASDITAYACEVYSCGGSAGAVAMANQSLGLYGCYIHNNSGIGVAGGNKGALVNCVVASNGSYGMNLTNANGMVVVGNLFYGNGGAGFRSTVGTNIHRGSFVVDNIFAKNTGYGFDETQAAIGYSALLAWAEIDYNGFWSNSSGAINGITNGTHAVAISGTDPTNDPFVAKASANWALNTTAGAGALLRATGFPGMLPGLTTSVGYLDIGPYQHLYPSSIVTVNE